jgi:murein DD-endopeptidase MepM/ murein hydrolase activator NlpD
MQKFQAITRAGGVRRGDPWGHGHFGAGRGGRSHEGVDFAAQPGEEILSPIEGTVVRTAAPYKNDTRFTGVVVEGVGPWAGVQVKLFYVEGQRSGPVKAGERIGLAQNLQARYPNITNHVHLEIRLLGRLLSPDEAYRQCL